MQLHSFPFFEGGPFPLTPVFNDRVKILLSRITVILVCMNKLLGDFLPSKNGRGWKLICDQNINTNKEYNSFSESGFANLQESFVFFYLQNYPISSVRVFITIGGPQLLAQLIQQLKWPWLLREPKKPFLGFY